MKEKIIKLAESIDITQIGILKAEVFSDLGDILYKHDSVPMVTDNTNERINPFLLMSEAKSIIVCLFPYFTDVPKGNISKYAYGTDYHTVIQNKLSSIKVFLENSGYKAEIHADNSPLNDRYLAYKAGLGFIGENGFLINPTYGSYTFIGYIITDCPLTPDTPLENTCMKCMQCIKSCPGSAISENHRFNHEKCLSYITQKKGELTEEEQSIIKKYGSVWGCDMCQDVCPHNKNVPSSPFEEFTENTISVLEIDESISNKEFKRKYSDRAFSWRGKNVLLRNLKILNEK